MGTVNLKTPSGGLVILSPVNTASDVTITIPAITAGLVNDSANLLNIGSGQLVKDASGNVGLGVTPSAWASTHKAIQLQGGGSVYNNGADAYINVASNSYFNGTNQVYVKTAAATWYIQSAGAHSWYTAPSGTVGNPNSLHVFWY